MKKILLYLLIAILSVVGCTKNNPCPSPESSQEEIDSFLQEVFWDQVEVPEYEVTSEKKLTPEELLEAVLGPGSELDAEDREIKDEFLKRCEEKLEEDPDGAPAISFYTISFDYHTIDQNDKDIVLSAFMGWAMHDIGIYWWPYDQNHVLFCCPYTHTLRDECATLSGGGKEFLLMWSDNLFIMPDGQGFGTDDNKIQTYLNHGLHARQYYDALKVGQKLYQDKYGKLEKDWTLRVIGASQGAGDGIALHKYLDTHYKEIDLTKYYENGSRTMANILCKLYGYPEGTKKIKLPLRDEHRFEYSYVCCGPYCPEVTMQTYSEWKQMSYPCVIPLVIKSMLACYPEQLKKYREEDFFSKKWNANKADFDNIYLKKSMKSDDLNEYIFKKLGVNKSYYTSPMVPLDSLLSADMLNTNSQIYKDLMSCLKKQDLTSAWTPRTKTKLRYTQNDEVVPYANTEKLIKLFEADNCTCKKSEDSWQDGEYKIRIGHVRCCERYVIGSWDW